MNDQFRDQGGAASMSPSPMARWLTSQVVRRVSSIKRRDRKRAAAEKSRKASGAGHVVEFFYQVDDGYSHLAAQTLRDLLDAYDIELVFHLVAGPSGDNSAEPELLLDLARVDSLAIAPHYGLAFPADSVLPDKALQNLARSVLAQKSADEFANLAPQVGAALWSGNRAELESLAERAGHATSEQVTAAVIAGDARRAELKHYSGAMFYYAGEWYWGVDRLYHLEKRLIALKAVTAARSGPLFPRPAIEVGGIKDNGRLTLEVYPSLRSPYTAMSFDRALKLAADTGVTLKVKPVLPMVMRGVPATREKGIYIFSDAVREAHELGMTFGKMYDPIGDPVRRCYSIYPWACEQHRGNELLSEFLKAAFVEGINTNSDHGLQHVVENAGLDWNQAKSRVGDSDWEALLEANRQEMYGFGCWGVPSFRLLDADGEQVLALWGQDRLWLFAREITRLLATEAA